MNTPMTELTKSAIPQGLGESAPRSKTPYEWQKTHRRRHPDRARARWSVRAAIKTGRLVRRPCFCGEGRVEAHHPRGYTGEHKLDVEWLCRADHLARQAEGRSPERERANEYMRRYRARRREATDVAA